MKPAAFEYMRPSGVPEACAMLADAGDDAKILAGGQTLVPLMAMRFARPTLLVDINRLEGLAGIEDRGETVEIGALARQRAVERSAITRNRLPILAKALPYVGHIQTRTRGTIGGSLVHGDPSAEIPLVALVLDARLHLTAGTGEREGAGEDFFEGPMTTAAGPAELLTRIAFPTWPNEATIGTAFLEMAPRAGDYALVSVAVQIAFGSDGRCRRAAIGIGGCAPTPLRLQGIESELTGEILSVGVIDSVVKGVADALDPEDTLQASAAYRRRVAPELLRRALIEAREESET